MFLYQIRLNFSVPHFNQQSAINPYFQSTWPSNSLTLVRRLFPGVKSLLISFKNNSWEFQELQITFLIEMSGKEPVVYDVLHAAIEIAFGIFGLLSFFLLNDVMKRARFVCKILAWQMLVSSCHFIRGGSFLLASKFL